MTLIFPATTKCLAGATPEAMSSKKLTSSSSQGVTRMLLAIKKVFTSTFSPAKRTCWLSSKYWVGGLELTSRLSKHHDHPDDQDHPHPDHQDHPHHDHQL